MTAQEGLDGHPFFSLRLEFLDQKDVAAAGHKHSLSVNPKYRAWLGCARLVDDLRSKELEAAGVEKAESGGPGIKSPDEAGNFRGLLVPVNEAVILFQHWC
jgi:hypothetical protein